MTSHPEHATGPEPPTRPVSDARARSAPQFPVVLFPETAGRAALVLRRAQSADVPEIVSLLTADDLAAARGESLEASAQPAYERAFTRIDADPAHLLVVVQELLVVAQESVPGHTADPAARTSSARSPIQLQPIVATMQLTFIPGMARSGALRLHIEAVRVAASHQHRGIGSLMIRWACEEGQRRGATLAQLTSDATRLAAHGFYRHCGFTQSHVGFKKALHPDT